MDMDLRPGSEPIAGYTLIDRLGRGGFGEVWKATGPGGFHVALKFVPLDESVGPVELRALEVIKGIRHPHLLGTFGSWQAAGRLVIAMELADRTLLDRFREAVGQGFPGIPAPEVFEHFLDASKALDFLNEPRHPAGGSGPQGIQHRDVKPQNLLLVGGSVKVADFGLARVLEHTSTGHTGSMTPSYAAPEFFDHKTSSQSDQYSLAVTYCHLRGGRLPFEGNPAVVMAGHVMRPPDLSMIPEAERGAVGRALAKSPRDRWPSCRAFVQAVMDSAGDRHAPPTVAPADSTWRKTTQPDPGTLTPPPKPEPLSELDPAPTASASTPRWPYLVGATVLAVGILLVLGWFFASPRQDLAGNGSVDPKPPVPNPAPTPPLAPPSPKDATASRAHIEKGLALLGKEENDRAIAEFDEAIRLDPTAALAFAGRGFARSLTPFRRGLALTKGQQAQTKRQQAEKDCDEALRLDPRLALGHAARGLMLMTGTSPDFSKALEETQEANRLDPDSALGYLARAHIFFRRGSQENQKADVKVATKISSKAIQLDSKLVAAYYLRGNARRINENYDGALEDYEMARRLDPDSSRPYFLSGLVWQEKGDNARAIRNYSEAIAKSPDQIPAYNKRAEVYEANGDRARAEADRRQAARLAVKLEKPESSR
jgi:serine/threonine protein kinase